MENDKAIGRVRKSYAYFAENEAHGKSSLYEELATAVCSDESLIDFVVRLPIQKQQPNLVFAAVRHLFGTPENAQHFSELVKFNREPIRKLILERNTQTNEPGRCAALLPALSMLPQPLALIEVGASAGLCLLVDRYGYDYGERRLDPRTRSEERAPIFPCDANNLTPAPAQIPEIIWRIGLDLNPINLNDPEEVSWLETLVWPGQEARAARLNTAIRIAQQNPPTVIKGDLLTDLHELVTTAPRNATLVIFHSAVLGYLQSRDDINRFVSSITNIPATWISNESPLIFPEFTTHLADPPPGGQFLLAIDGSPVAFTDPHGQYINWIGHECDR
ncbi:MAG: DUF2332 domain-containing protein [Alphaproteobacteria bacterium]|nr:DUF2332 domain-containing protein [Alphaproteobacteria bacterium]